MICISIKLWVFFFPKSMFLFQSMLYLTLLVDVYDTLFVIFWNVAVLKLELALFKADSICFARHKECKLQLESQWGFPIHFRSCWRFCPSSTFFFSFLEESKLVYNRGELLDSKGKSILILSDIIFVFFFLMPWLHALEKLLSVKFVKKKKKSAYLEAWD